jgi:hypothetical protein
MVGSLKIHEQVMTRVVWNMRSLHLEFPVFCLEPFKYVRFVCHDVIYSVDEVKGKRETYSLFILSIVEQIL